MSGAGKTGRFLSDKVDVTAFGEAAVAPLTPQVLIHFPYNLNTDIVNSAVVASGTVTHSGQFAVISSGAASSSSAMLFSNRFLEYHPGMGALARFTAIFTDGVEGNQQICGPGNDTDGFFFGYEGTVFGVMRRAGGVETFIPQSSWNIDKYDGTGPSLNTLDTSKGNVYQIKFQWLGFGAISFYIENQRTGNLDLVHRIDYANENITTSIENPSLPFCVSSANTTNDTDIVIQVPSIGMFIEGTVTNVSHTRNAIDNSKTISTLENILTIRNKTTYQSIPNAIQIQPDFLSIAADGTKNVTIKILINATLGGTPSYTDISTNTSVVDYDTAGTTISGGTLVAVIELAKTGSKDLLFSDYDFIMPPGSTMTVAAVSTSNNDVSASISWQERFT